MKKWKRSFEEHKDEIENLVIDCYMTSAETGMQYVIFLWDDGEFYAYECSAGSSPRPINYAPEREWMEAITVYVNPLSLNLPSKDDEDYDWWLDDLRRWFIKEELPDIMDEIETNVLIEDRHVTVEDIADIIAKYPACELVDGTDDRLCYYKYACNDGTLVENWQPYDKCFTQDVWLNEKWADVDIQGIYADFETLEDEDFYSLCNDLAFQVNEWFDELNDDALYNLR